MGNLTRSLLSGPLDAMPLRAMPLRGDTMSDMGWSWTVGSAGGRSGAAWDGRAGRRGRRGTPEQEGGAPKWRGRGTREGEADERCCVLPVVGGRVEEGAERLGLYTQAGARAEQRVHGAGRRPSRLGGWRQCRGGKNCSGVLAAGREYAAGAQRGGRETACDTARGQRDTGRVPALSCLPCHAASFLADEEGADRAAVHADHSGGTREVPDTAPASMGQGPALGLPHLASGCPACISVSPPHWRHAGRLALSPRPARTPSIRPCGRCISRRRYCWLQAPSSPALRTPASAPPPSTAAPLAPASGAAVGALDALAAGRAGARTCGRWERWTLEPGSQGLDAGCWTRLGVPARAVSVSSARQQPATGNPRVRRAGTGCGLDPGSRRGYRHAARKLQRSTRARTHARSRCSEALVAGGHTWALAIALAPSETGARGRPRAALQ